jgi:hypothetical protein
VGENGVAEDCGAQNDYWVDTANIIASDDMTPDEIKEAYQKRNKKLRSFWYCVQSKAECLEKCMAETLYALVQLLTTVY